MLQLCKGALFTTWREGPADGEPRPTWMYGTIGLAFGFQVISMATRPRGRN